MINFYVRLKESELAYNSVFTLLKKLTGENLLTISVSDVAGAKLDIFILDGNEAGTSGIAEMLVQSHEGYIEFLPALPEEWNTGYYKGLCVRGGGETEVTWDNGIIKMAILKATTNNVFNIKVPGTGKVKFLKNGKSYNVDSIERGILSIKLNKNDILQMMNK